MHEYVRAGAFTKIYDPGVGEPEDWYINDHCFIRDAKGLWHMVGITQAEPGGPYDPFIGCHFDPYTAPYDEKCLAHATAPTLTQQPWQKQPFALCTEEEAPWHERHLWAPHIVEYQGRYFMFYCAGDDDPTQYKLHLATSTDLKHWTRHPQNPVVVDGYHARDPFVMRHEAGWVMYYTGTSAPEGGHHVVLCQTSTDLIHWEHRREVFRDARVGRGGGPTESPFVVRRGPYYYLFIGPRGGYVGTDVFRSKDLFQWTVDGLAGHIDAHAAEVVRDTDGAWYVSHCGWGKGGLYLAPLLWDDGLDNAETSMPAG